jgi:hypothetical protein
MTQRTPSPKVRVLAQWRRTEFALVYVSLAVVLLGLALLSGLWPLALTGMLVVVLPFVGFFDERTLWLDRERLVCVNGRRVLLELRRTEIVEVEIREWRWWNEVLPSFEAWFVPRQKRVPLRFGKNLVVILLDGRAVLVPTPAGDGAMVEQAAKELRQWRPGAGGA